MKTCYTVVARLKSRTTHACHEKSYEILADSTAPDNQHVPIP